jgi:hypothetical protein
MCLAEVLTAGMLTSTTMGAPLPLPFVMVVLTVSVTDTAAADSNSRRSELQLGTAVP